MDGLEQKCHNLEIKLKRTEDERNNVVTENDDLQAVITTMSEAKSNAEQKLLETKKELFKLNDEFQRLEAVCANNQDHISSINDKVNDLLNVKNLIQQISDESATLKEEFQRMKNRYNVATKLELQTQEQLYESRLLHLESVLEEMKQSECQFLRLAEETNILKDQVDYLRELSVSALKSETPNENVSVSSLQEKNEYHHRALENELKSQFTSLYQSISNLRMDKDLLLMKEVEQDEQPSLSRPLTLAETAEAGVMTSIATETEPTTNYLLVQGRLKVTAKRGSGQEKRKDFRVNEQTKSGCLTDLLTKIWITFFD